MDTIKNNKTPWTRLKNESTLAYSFFTIYRDLGSKRSYKQVQEHSGKKKSYLRQIEKWSRKYLWVYRAALYDDHLDNKKLELADQRLRELHDHAMTRAKETIDRLIDIANGYYCEPMHLKAIEIYLKSIGFMREDPHLNKLIHEIPARQEAEIRRIKEMLSKFKY